MVADTAAAVDLVVVATSTRVVDIANDRTEADMTQ